MPNLIEPTPTLKTPTLWRNKPEYALVGDIISAHMDAVQIAACNDVWELLSNLSADADMLWVYALYRFPDLIVTTAPLRQEQKRLLDGLQASRKVWHIYQQHQPNGNAEGLRRLLLALILDLRVLIILLAEQLHTLRNAMHLPEAERLAAAKLSFDIHAPLANRLGIWQLKWELEDLAFRYMMPEQFQSIAKQLHEKRVNRERYIERSISSIQKAVSDAGIHADVAGRPKHIYSIWKKMQKKNLDFDGLYDIRAVRVLVNSIADCYSVLGIVHQLWTPISGEFDDYIAQPKINHYQSLHTAVIGPEGLGIEIQIRTFDMHAHAEMGVAAHWRYKEGGKAQGEFEKKIAQMRQLLENSKASDEPALLSGIGTELVEDRKYLITPKGAVIDLPPNGTVLDFAYHVHTDVGHRCRGAKVNGRIVPLEFQPQSGDSIEILTGKTGTPKRDWLLAANGYLASSRARDKVRSYFFRLDRQRNLDDGREMLEKELRRVALMQVELKPVLEKLKYPDRDELCIALALGDITPGQISRALYELSQPITETPVVRKTQTVRKAAKPGALTVEGVGNLLIQLARCCQPVAGEAIVGYLTKSKGVSIHRLGCASVMYLLQKSPERELPVNWGRREDSRYEVAIYIRAYDRKWLLKDLTNTIAQANVSIVGVNALANDGSNAELRMSLKVSDFEQLSGLLSKLNAIPGMLEVRRFV